MVFKLISLLTLTSFLGLVLFRALFLFKPLPPPKACIDTAGHERIKLSQKVLDRFKGGLNIPTVSWEEGRYEPSQLVRLIDYIESNYPLIHQSSFVKREIHSNYSLLYTVQGANSNLKPYLLTSHLDVVPTVDESWSSKPFEATVKDDQNIYARGTIDAKHLLFAMLEAFEHMLKRGFRPQRSFYLVFGHDEEIGGKEGAKVISEILAERIVQSGWTELEYVLDEGTVISKTRFPGIKQDVALIGVVEKGYLTVKLTAAGEVGHGSMPNRMTAISKLSQALSKFHSHLLPSFMGQGIERNMLDIMASYAAWPYKVAYANFWLFQPIIDYVFSSDPSLNALIRSTTAVTMVKGGTKENVLPDSAVAFINHRIHPSQTLMDIVNFDERIINDPSIKVEISGHHSEPTSIAPHCDDCYGYQLIKQSVLQIYPGSIVVPCTFLGASDSRWYQNLTRSIYKFSAIAVHLEELKRFHGHDERISLKNYENLINFYHHLIENSDAVKLDFKPKLRKDL